MEPLVSVVIPTRGRPLLVRKAVASALAQTLQHIEVIVVIDGTDAETQRSLSTITDPRLRVLEHSVSKGCIAARTTGIHAAQAKWIAHLDDDDEWMPQKLERQLAAVTQSAYLFPIATCYAEVQFSHAREVFPHRMPQPGEPLSEYLFVRNTLFQGEGLIQSSTVLTAKELYISVPYASEIHEDWAWLLNAIAQEGVGIEFVPETLSVWNLEALRPSLSRSIKWQESRDWIQGHRHLVTPRAYSSFLLAEVSARAAAAQAWQAFLPLLWEALRLGQPTVKDVGLFCGMWLVPPQVRGWLRANLTQPRRVATSEL